MRIKQKDLIGKLPQITYTKTLSNQSSVIIQVFNDPKCVNMIKKKSDKVIERQCYPLNDKQYQSYVNGSFEKGNCIKTFWQKLRSCLWS